MSIVRQVSKTEHPDGWIVFPRLGMKRRAIPLDGPAFLRSRDGRISRSLAHVGEARGGEGGFQVVYGVLGGVVLDGEVDPGVRRELLQGLHELL